jgi:hypothetical protein
MAVHIVLRDGRHLTTPNEFCADILRIVVIFNELSRDDGGPFVPVDLPGTGGMLIRLDEVLAVYSEEEPDTVTVSVPAQVECAMTVQRDSRGRIIGIAKT